MNAAHDEDVEATIATIRRRKRAETSLSDSACTPEWLCEMLPMVDIDPCSNPRSQVRARWAFSLEKGYDGKKMPWRGSVFENFTYSAPEAWVEKTQYELRIGRCTEAIVLCKLDTTTQWWHQLIGFDTFAARGEPLADPPDVWTFDKRLQFDEHPNILEQRRQERMAEYQARCAKAGKPPDPRRLNGITGVSSNNFCSAIVHHRSVVQRSNGQWDRGPRLRLGAVATLWVRAF